MYVCMYRTNLFLFTLNYASWETPYHKEGRRERQNSEEAAEQVYFHLTTKYR